jgi:signal transduction histidine kinase/CheY-like chemotaxis protein
LDNFSADIAAIERIPAVPTILDVICRTTGMGFAAVARVTEDRWIACSVLDNIDFGLKSGGELRVETTICHEIRQSGNAVVIDHVAEDGTFCNHQTPQQYGFQSYISMPIRLPSGEMFGTLCAIDPRPARVNTPEVIGMFTLFAELIAFHIDASERLLRSESRLEAERGISELREQFIGVLGHDLRNPLGALAMGARLLKESALDDDQTKTVEMMLRSISRMSGLIDDALDFTRGRLGGGITLDSPSVESVEPVLRQVIEEVAAIWPNRVIEAHFDLREAIQHDRKRIAQLFTNLLSNAMIYGKAGAPVKVRVESREAKFELSVANAADPIPPAVLQRLFEPFQRGGAGDYQQGLGLGLYIASEIARSHNGVLAVTSVQEETRFTFTMPSLGIGVPLTAPAKSDEMPAGQMAQAGMLDTPPAPSAARILLIDDHADTLNILTRLLTRKGHAITPAANGAEARAEFARGNFDLVVSDLGLPDCSGLELMGELRAARPIPAIAMSGYGMEADVQSCIAAGFSEHVTKPIDFELFLETVNRLTRKGGS